MRHAYAPSGHVKVRGCAITAHPWVDAGLAVGGFLDDRAMIETGIQPAWSTAEVNTMLYYALVFLVIALIAALLGFGGIAIAFAGIAKLLFVVFLVLFLVSFVIHLGRRV